MARWVGRRDVRAGAPISEDVCVELPMQEPGTVEGLLERVGLTVEDVPSFASLSVEDAAALYAVLRELEKRQLAVLAESGDAAVKILPRPLRRPVKAILGAPE